MLYQELQKLAGHALLEDGIGSSGYHSSNISNQLVLLPHQLYYPDTNSTPKLKHEWDSAKIAWLIQDRQLNWYGLSRGSTVITQGEMFIKESKEQQRPLVIRELVLDSPKPQSFAYELDVIVHFEVRGTRDWYTRHAMIVDKELYDRTKATMRIDSNLTENILSLGDFVFPNVYKRIRNNTLPTKYTSTGPAELQKPFRLLELDDVERFSATLG